MITTVQLIMLLVSREVVGDMAGVHIAHNSMILVNSLVRSQFIMPYNIHTITCDL